MLSSFIKMVQNCEGVPMYLMISSYVPPPKVTGAGGDILISFDNRLILSFSCIGMADLVILFNYPVLEICETIQSLGRCISVHELNICDPSRKKGPSGKFLTKLRFILSRILQHFTLNLTPKRVL